VTQQLRRVRPACERVCRRQNANGSVEQLEEHRWLLRKIASLLPLRLIRAGSRVKASENPALQFSLVAFDPRLLIRGARFLILDLQLVHYLLNIWNGGCDILSVDAPCLRVHFAL
jgi:hypothetical protein